MANVKYVLGLLTGIVIATAAAAQAQTPSPATEKFFANVNVGGQLASRTIDYSYVLPTLVNKETATLSGSQAVNRGLTIDFGGGYRVWNDVFAGLVIAWYHDSETAGTSTSVPDILFFNRPKIVTGSTADLGRTELAIAPHAVWAMALTDNIDITFAAGISFVRLSQDIVGSFTVPENTQNVTLNATTETGSGVGPFAQVDFIYNLGKPLWALGGFVRYAGAKVDLDTVQDLNVGGVQVGGGIRLRF